MKMEVFEYLVALEKYGSLNQAAQHLYVSQPNLSNVLTTFENELGYPVLYRNHQGIQFTEQGKQVLLIAHQILKEKEKLLNLNLEHQKISFNISIGNGDFALAPIYQLIKGSTLQDEIDITILNCSVVEALNKTYQRLIDIAYFIIPVDMEREIKDYALSHHLLMTHLKTLTCQINFRENHPLLQHFSKEALWNYPFVDYFQQQPHAYGVYQQYINPQKRIKVDHHSLRSQIVSETDAFSIGIPLNHQLKQRLHIIGIPTPELMMRIYEIRRESDQNNHLFNQCRQIIEQHLLEFCC